MTKPLAWRFLYAFLILTFFCAFGCSSWRGVLVSNVTADEAENLVGKHVRFHTTDGVKSMTVRSVDYPYVDGTVFEDSFDRPGETIRVDLRHVERIEVYSTDVGKGFRWTIFVALVLVVASFIVVQSAFEN